ncbi:hypothetical protein B0T21DRAFT_349935 [Apiosordaria backusii]|uniref:Uncharacterized protein n=1 Tax=Apiosordaria backusii TaxID=314023 RepID=A0AA40B7C0_9PEZI|nr:hypothetical protein B0T21DRAFT_349935 [Apiosordaria backusii]
MCRASASRWVCQAADAKFVVDSLELRRTNAGRAGNQSEETALKGSRSGTPTPPKHMMVMFGQVSDGDSSQWGSEPSNCRLSLMIGCTSGCWARRLRKNEDVLRLVTPTRHLQLGVLGFRKRQGLEVRFKKTFSAGELIPSRPGEAREGRDECRAYDRGYY